MATNTELLAQVVQTNTDLTNTIEQEVGKWQGERDRLANEANEILSSGLAGGHLAFYLDQNAADGGNGQRDTPFNTFKAFRHTIGKISTAGSITLVLLSDYELEVGDRGYLGPEKVIWASAHIPITLDLAGHTFRSPMLARSATSSSDSTGLVLHYLDVDTTLLNVYNGVIQFFAEGVHDDTSKHNWYLRNEAAMFRAMASLYRNQTFRFSRVRFEPIDQAGQIRDFATQNRHLVVGSANSVHSYAQEAQDCRVIFRDCTYRHLDSETGEVKHSYLNDARYHSLGHSLMQYRNHYHGDALKWTKFGLTD
ncbi:hypothetical protein [Pseudoalteromonas sp. T1lg23B]|uniref:hypothetical protein n=1 Tax=Pseudoalteromonas sp. T1lg23B TaxID=2077097 RepID=UPI000CF66F32|nr:hypothetical protein [Pseudoalteromonas sp. T1lg23B]